MKSLLLLAFASFAVFQTANSTIKCYVCAGAAADCTKEKLESNREKYLMECGHLTTHPRCIKMTTKKGDVRGVAMTCGNKLSCDLLRKTCTGDESCQLACCQTDACNDGTSVYISALLLILCVLLGAMI